MIKIKFILIVMLMFLSGCAVNSQFVGKVNKDWIQKEEYMFQLRKAYESFMIEHNYSPDIEQRKILADQAWNNIVNAYILKDILTEHSITVSQREVLDTLRTNIPQLVLDSPRFKNNRNEFDYDSYYSSLVRDKPENLAWLRQYYEFTHIPLKKLELKILSERKISQNDLNDLYNLKNTRVKIEKYLFDLNYYLTDSPTESFMQDNNALDMLTISDAEIEAYYKENKREYFVEPRTDLNWIIIDNVPSKDDSLNTKILADSLFMSIQNGKSFAELAVKHSAPPYNRVKGYAGFMELSSFDPEIADKINDVDEGQLIKPFFRESAWWIIKVDEKTISMAKLNIIKIEIKASQKTLADNKRLLDRFSELSYRVGFTRAANELSLKLNTETNLSLQNNHIESLGNVENIIRRAMRLPDKTIFEPILINNNRTYIVFQVDKNTPGYYKNLLEVYDDINHLLRVQKSKTELIKQVSLFRNNFNRDSLDKELIVIKDIDYDKDKSFYSYNFLKECFLQSEGILTSVYHDDNFVYFAKVLTKQAIENKLPFSTQIPYLTSELQALNGNEYFNEWLKKQMSKRKVRDLRPDDLF